jgi:hypothetical protein
MNIIWYHQKVEHPKVVAMSPFLNDRYYFVIVVLFLICYPQLCHSSTSSIDITIQTENDFESTFDQPRSADIKEAEQPQKEGEELSPTITDIPGESTDDPPETDWSDWKDQTTIERTDLSDTTTSERTDWTDSITIERTDGDGGTEQNNQQYPFTTSTSSSLSTQNPQYSERDNEQYSNTESDDSGIATTSGFDIDDRDERTQQNTVQYTDESIIQGTTETGLSESIELWPTTGEGSGRSGSDNDNDDDDDSGSQRTTITIDGADNGEETASGSIETEFDISTGSDELGDLRDNKLPTDDGITDSMSEYDEQRIQIDDASIPAITTNTSDILPDNSNSDTSSITTIATTGDDENRESRDIEYDRQPSSTSIPIPISIPTSITTDITDDSDASNRIPATIKEEKEQEQEDISMLPAVVDERTVISKLFYECYSDMKVVCYDYDQGTLFDIKYGSVTCNTVAECGSSFVYLDVCSNCVDSGLDWCNFLMEDHIKSDSLCTNDKSICKRIASILGMETVAIFSDECPHQSTNVTDSVDCNSNGIKDETEVFILEDIVDENRDGIIDSCQIIDGEEGSDHLIPLPGIPMNSACNCTIPSINDNGCDATEKLVIVNNTVFIELPCTTTSPLHLPLQEQNEEEIPVPRQYRINSMLECGEHGIYSIAKNICVCFPGWFGERCDVCNHPDALFLCCPVESNDQHNHQEFVMIRAPSIQIRDSFILPALSSPLGTPNDMMHYQCFVPGSDISNEDRLDCSCSIKRRIDSILPHATENTTDNKISSSVISTTSVNDYESLSMYASELLNMATKERMMRISESSRIIEMYYKSAQKIESLSRSSIIEQQNQEEEQQPPPSPKKTRNRRAPQKVVDDVADDDSTSPARSSTNMIIFGVCISIVFILLLGVVVYMALTYKDFKFVGQNLQQQKRMMTLMQQQQQQQQQNPLPSANNNIVIIKKTKKHRKGSYY